MRLDLNQPETRSQIREVLREAMHQAAEVYRPVVDSWDLPEGMRLPALAELTASLVISSTPNLLEFHGLTVDQLAELTLAELTGAN
jgi:hypothetical protein